MRLEPSIEAFDPECKLWDYELVQDATVVLSGGDYHDLKSRSRPEPVSVKGAD